MIALVAKDLFQIMVGLIGIVGMLGAAAALFRSNLAKATIEQLKENNEALEGRVGFLETERTRQMAQIEALMTENEVLKRLATGQELMASFQAEVIELERQQSREHTSIVEAIRGLAQEIQRGRAS